MDTGDSESSGAGNSAETDDTMGDAEGLGAVEEVSPSHFASVRPHVDCGCPYVPMHCSCTS
jgi:hypothetical protein